MTDEWEALKLFDELSGLAFVASQKLACFGSRESARVFLRAFPAWQVNWKRRFDD